MQEVQWPLDFRAMCIVILLLSLIPILSGYVIYLLVSGVAISAPDWVQVLLATFLLVSFGASVVWLVGRLRLARQGSLLTDEPGRVDDLQQGRSHEGGDQSHQHHHGEQRR